MYYERKNAVYLQSAIRKRAIRNKLMDIIDVFVKGGYEVVVHPTQGAKDAGKNGKKHG